MLQTLNSQILNSIVFGWYPYLCLTVFLFGSLFRFDREQYTWRSGSSQLLRRRQLAWGSNLFGLGLGLVASVAATRIFQSMLFGTKPLDPMVLAGVIATLLAVAFLACLAPAWRASRLNPMQALRTE